MIVLGLTGSIGMGKSTVSAMFRAEGVPVFEADAAVHELYSGAAAPLIEEAFPGTVRDGVVDRKALSRAVFGKTDALRRLEAIVHPLVREAEARFIAKAQVDGHALAVLDIPLLLEGVDADRCDVVAVVSAPADVQRARVLARHGMTAETFEAILARQMPDEEKRAKADIVIDTGTSLEDTRKAVQEIIGQFSATPDNAKEG
ncbi:dephospho-CoA kinase [Terrihabitans rhizophilus]|uniref:Dephospho-CoA kinase n=1 Tax=Terrihabitans rhizophilus TaxID=3092662 RepID=A0ABU4RRQ3_9HYPH|nr:dephospho-CoA kinase [Terrihabitans sp. PJ23]MDX6807529.1 dephospho-CoA kinase [Terrihabitans sp. PJ23]